MLLRTLWRGLSIVALLAALMGLPAGKARAAIPRGRADVYLAPATLSARGGAGSTVTIAITVEPSGVGIDAASAVLTFDPQFLAVDDSAIVAGDVLPQVLQRSVDNARGTAVFSAGKLGGPWLDTPFTLATVTFRFVATPSGPLTIALATTGRPATDVASNGTSVLNTVRGATITAAGADIDAGGSGGSGSGAGGSGGSSGSAGGSPGGGGSGGSSSSGGSSGGGSSGGSSGGGSGVSGPAAPVSRPATQSGQPPVAPPIPASPPTSLAGTVGGSIPAPVTGRLVASGAMTLPASVQVGSAPVASPFAQFYADRQGLRVLGNTLGAERSVNGISAQYFEKGRAEDHADEPNPAWRFQYGLLVDELVAAGAPLPVGGDASTLTYATIQQLTQPGQRVTPPAGFVGGAMTLPDGSTFIPFSAALLPENGHVVPANFWNYINNQDLFPGGWLHDVGLPTTEPVEAVVDKGLDTGRHIVVQAFQRTVLTFDALNPPDYWVERANVGTDYARAFPEKFDG